jgi:hypothetical protein
METYESNPEYVQVIGQWDGEDHGPIIDWLTEKNYPHCVQVEELSRAQDRALRQASKTSQPTEIKQAKVLAILGTKMYQHTTVEPGNLLVVRQDLNGDDYPSEMDPGYLANGFRKTETVGMHTNTSPSL